MVTFITDKDHHEVARTLLEVGADVNAKDNVRKQKLLMMILTTITIDPHPSSHSMHPSNYLSFYSTHYHQADLGEIVYSDDIVSFDSSQPSSSLSSLSGKHS